MTPIEALKPCPFCGSEAELMEVEEMYWGNCKKCDCTRGWNRESFSMNEAIAAWNQRTQAEQDWLTKPDPADTDWDEVPGKSMNDDRSCQQCGKPLPHTSTNPDSECPGHIAQTQTAAPQPERTLDLRGLKFAELGRSGAKWIRLGDTEKLIRAQLPDVKVLT